MYSYNSPIGQMLIYFDERAGKYALRICDIVYEHHDSALSAADNVYMHSTGCPEWDNLDGKVNAPTDIYEWEKI